MDKPDNLLDAILQQVRDAGMRKTRALVDVLEALLAASRPLNLNELGGDYEMPTISRLMNRLEEAGIVQKLGFRNRAAYFTLRLDNRHHDYLVCTDCGSIEALEIACPVRELETRIAKKHRFKGVYHELEFYGLCPTCQ